MCVAQVKSLAAAGELVEKLERELEGRSPKLLVTFLSPRFEDQDLYTSMKAKWPSAAWMSSTSGGEFTGSQESEGAVVWALGGEVEVHTGFSKNVKSSLEQAATKVSETIPESVQGFEHRVGIVLLDPMSGCAEQATLMLAMSLERDEPVRLVGGVAADDFQMSTAKIGVNGEKGRDAMGLAMIYSKKPFGIGVGHGHCARTGELIVTRSAGSIVYEINHRPAWDVWIEEISEILKVQGIDFCEPEPGGELNLLLTYQAGVRIDGAQLKIRTPLKLLKDGALYFAGGLAEGAKISLTTGTAKSQVESAQGAANDARRQLNGAPLAGALVFDCACRKLILRDEFLKAVVAASEVFDHLPLAGFETYGEIALNDGDLSGFHNTSTVVLAVPA